ncbi:transposase [Streptomyces zagrosensis]|uniref:Transposase n=1 Tax=Streptomyces zagrosensis TaxID=1042984 RepID=A0A7W9V2V6_9ACTN|nr:transposase [Streptomyces zagrosensis]
MPGEFGPWPTVYGRFRVWRDAGVFTALLNGMIAEAANRKKQSLGPAVPHGTTAISTKSGTPSSSSSTS